MIQFYILDENKQPVPVKDCLEWAKWLKENSRTGNVLAKTFLGKMGVERFVSLPFSLGVIIVIGSTQTIQSHLYYGKPWYLVESMSI